MSKVVTLLIMAVGLTTSLQASVTELIDFSSKSRLIATEGLLGNDVSVDDFPLPVVNTVGGAFDRSKSTTAERAAMGVIGLGRPYYPTASLTYDLGSATFTVADDSPTDEICLWVHVDGPGVRSTGGLPTAKPWLLEIQLFTEGDRVYTSRRRGCSRGWNEIKFPLTTQVPQPKTPDPSLNHRITHFTSAGATGTTVQRIKIRILGTTDSADSYAVTKLRFNGCVKQSINSPCPIILMYDEAFSGVKTYAQPLIDAYGMKATLSVIGQYYNGPPGKLHLSRTEINDLYNDNSRFDLINHSDSFNPLHDDTHPLNYSTVFQRISRGMYALTNVSRNNGHRFLVYPAGAYDAQVFAAMDELGVVAARTNSPVWDPDADSSQLQDPYSLDGYDTCAAEHGLNGYNADYSLEQIEDWIDEGIAQGKPRIIILHDIHPLQSGNATYVSRTSNTPAWHAALLDYLHNLGSAVTFKTLPEWYNSLDTLHKLRGAHY